jgi:septum formation protein
LAERLEHVRLTLVSASPRRRDLLQEFDHQFDVRPSHAPENWSGSDAAAVAERNARMKVERSTDFRDRSRLLIGADTLIALDGQLFGKPQNESSAERMLLRLSGRRHDVLTGLCLAGPVANDYVTVGGCARSIVECERLAPDTIRCYLGSGEWAGKAGAYAIQGMAGEFFRLISGDRDNVVGLPLRLLNELLRTHFGDCRFR